MKKHSLSLLLTFLSISVLAQWNFVGPSAISSGATAYNNIGCDTSGNPITVYYDGDLSGARCMSYNGTQWNETGTSTLDSFDIGEILAFKIDRKNNYYIAFRNSMNYKLSCIRYNGSEWKYVGAQYISDDIISQFSIAVDTANILYFIYIVETGSKIVKENGDSWLPVTTDGIDSDIIYPDLKFDAGNVAYMGYCAASTIHCVKLTDDKWVPVGNTIESSAYYPLYTKLSISKDHDLYIVFDNQLTNCFKLNDQTNTWEILGVAGLGVEGMWSGDVESGSDNRIFISNEPILMYDRARCFTFDGDKWVQLGNSGISESIAGCAKIAINQYGNLFATYTEENSGKAVVKEDAVPTNFNPVPFDNPVRIYPNPVKGVLFIEQPGQKFSVTIMDTKGNMVYVSTPASDKVEIHTETFGKGVYLVRIITGKGTYSCRKLIVM
jgi:hypothetical protein